MILAGDLGGTKTLLGLFERDDPRPQPHWTRGYPTQEFDSFIAILETFAREIGERPVIEAAAVGAMEGTDQSPLLHVAQMILAHVLVALEELTLRDVSRLRRGHARSL